MGRWEDMLRPPSPTALLSLLHAAAMASDTELDLALLRLDVLAPADLDEIREELSRPQTTVTAAFNPDGHRIIEISHGANRAALLHHDGRLQSLHVAAA